MTLIKNLELRENTKEDISIAFFDPESWTKINEVDLSTESSDFLKKNCYNCEKIVEKLLEKNSCSVFNVDTKEQNVDVPVEFKDLIEFDLDNGFPAGFPDLICRNGNDFFLVEVKRGNSGLTKSQLRFWKNNDYDFYIC